MGQPLFLKHALSLGLRPWSERFRDRRPGVRDSCAPSPSFAPGRDLDIPSAAGMRDALADCPSLATLDVSQLWTSRREVSALVAAVSMIAVAAGCNPAPPPQAAREAQAAAAVRAAIIFYENDFPGRQLTNLAQVFEHTSASAYPHYLDRWFRPYGNKAGFTNSFYEKYVFVPRGIIDARVPGEILLVSSQPFPDRQGHMNRVIVFRDPSSDIRADNTILPE